MAVTGSSSRLPAIKMSRFYIVNKFLRGVRAFATAQCVLLVTTGVAQSDEFFTHLSNPFVVKEDSVATPIAVNSDTSADITRFVTSLSDPANGSAQIIDGVIYYTPNPDFVGDDSIIYTLNDGSSATANIRVNRSHQQPHGDIDNWIADPDQRSLLADQLDDMATELSPDGTQLILSRWAKLPLNPAMDAITTRDGKTYVVAQSNNSESNFPSNDGKIFEISRDLDTGVTTVSEFFDIGAMIRDLPETLGLNIELVGGKGDGPRSLAFHPDFDDPLSPGYGKLYISMVATADPDMDPNDFLSSVEGGATLHNVTFEVTYDFTTQSFPSNTYREIIRDQPSVRQHPVRDIGFNPYAQPGDEDYGLLHIIHGDGERNGRAIDRGAGQLNNGSGKLLRVNPLQNGDAAYSVPDSNPFVGNPDHLSEIYALGLRNEHTMSFYQDPEGESHIVLTGIGFTNIDEINIVGAGDNLGWSLREGHFISDQEDGNTTSLAPLPISDWENNLVYPVSFVAHDAPVGQPGDVGQALSGAHVVDNGSPLDGKYVFADFSSSSRAYTIDVTDMLSVKTTLDENEDPSELSWVTPSEAVILFNHDNNSSTAPLPVDNFIEIVNPSGSRSDVRFGKGAEGEILIMNKFDGWVYIVENSVPPGYVLLGTETDEPVDTEFSPVDANADHYVIDNDLEVLNIFAFGGAAGVIANDTFSGTEPVVIAVNELLLPTDVNAESQPFWLVDGSNGGVFTLAANGQLEFFPGSDFDDLGDNQSRSSRINYTLEDSQGNTDTAEIIVTVKGNANNTIELNFKKDGGTGPLIVGSSYPFNDSTEWIITEAPVALTDAILIPRSNATSAQERVGNVATFTVTTDGYLYVAIEPGVLPAWLSEFAATSETLTISNGDESVELLIYGRRVVAGMEIQLPTANSTVTGAQFQTIGIVTDAALFEEVTAWSFVSIPDLFNADYADLSGGADASIAAVFSDNYSDLLIAAPNWTPSGPNSMNAEFATILHQMMDDIAASTNNDPELALIAGDLIGGRWPQHRSSLQTLFGNDDTTLEQELDAASASYYSWIRTLFAESGINTVVAAIGDHDIGDNNWSINNPKAAHVDNMKTDFGDHMVDPLFENLTELSDDPNASWEDIRFGPADGNFDEASYVYQKNNVLFVSVDVFRYEGGEYLGSFGAVAPEVTGDHLSWIHQVLLRAEADNTVDHVIVQGHTPILGPVNANRSSEMTLNEGVDSSLWTTIGHFGTDRGGKVRAYFAGEVHATTTLLDPTSGIVQISHGALVQAINGNFDNSDPTFLGIEVSNDGLSIDITEYMIDLNRIGDTSIVWEVDRPISTAHDTYVSGPLEIGTLSIDVSSGALDLNAAGSLVVSNVIPSTLDFTPDPTKVYHIDNPALGLRLAAVAGSEELESRTLDISDEDTQWQFVPSPTAGLWHIQRAAGGDTPRIRTDKTESPDMQEITSSGIRTQFSIEANPNIPGTYLLTLPLPNIENQRLRVRADGTTEFTTTKSVGNWPSFIFVEVK